MFSNPLLLQHFTDTELTLAKQIVFEVFIGDPSRYQSENPTAIILGGQPASGKSGLILKIQVENTNPEFAAINGDEYRQYHPRAQEIDEEYGQDAPKYTQPFSNTLVEYLKTECLRLRCNFIIEGTMRTYAVIERTAQEIKQAGFRCEAHALAVHRQDSLLGVFQRFEADKQRTGVGRFSPIAVHDEAYRQIPLNLAKADAEKLFDRLVVYTREQTGQLIMGIDRLSDAVDPLDFLALFDQLRQPIFDDSFYGQQWLALRALAQSRGETDPAYLKPIGEFVAQFG